MRIFLKEGEETLFCGLQRTLCFGFLFCQNSLWILWSVYLLTGPVSHEQKLSQSLEIALTSTLGSMPSFTSRLTRGQLQHLSTRGGSTFWRPGTSSGKSCPSPQTLEQNTGPCLWDSGPPHPGSPSSNSQAVPFLGGICLWSVTLHRKGFLYLIPSNSGVLGLGDFGKI